MTRRRKQPSPADDKTETIAGPNWDALWAQCLKAPAPNAEEMRAQGYRAATDLAQTWRVSVRRAREKCAQLVAAGKLTRATGISACGQEMPYYRPAATPATPAKPRG